MLSKDLNENYELHKDGVIVFESGAEYSKSEWKKLLGLKKEEIRAIHNVKTVFTEGKVMKIVKPPQKKVFGKPEILI